MILSNMLWVPKERVENPKALKKELTVKPKYDNRVPIETYVETEEYLGLPRNFIVPPEDTKDERIVSKRIQCRFTGELRQVQESMFEDWKTLYGGGVSDWVIKGDTGVGKTIIMLKIACELKVPFLVIVPLERLMTYWIDQIQAFTTVKKIGKVQQDVCDYEGKQACVGMVHSLCKDKYPQEFKDYFGLIIIDELQNTGSEQFSKVLPMFKAKHRLGASATLERQDGTEDVYFYHLGKNIISSEKKTQPKPRVFFHHYEKSSGRVPSWVDKYDPIKLRASILTMLSKNKERNEQIADFAGTLMDKGLQTLVIGDRIAQLQEIQKYLKEKGYTNTGLYIGKTPDAEKRRIEKEADCILATLKMLEIGIDIDTLRGLVFATPKSDVHQVVGRIRRINPNVPLPVVVDIIDPYPETKRWATKRKRFYEEQAFTVKYTDGV